MFGVEHRQLGAVGSVFGVFLSWSLHTSLFKPWALAGWFPLRSCSTEHLFLFLYPPPFFGSSLSRSVYCHSPPNGPNWRKKKKKESIQQNNFSFTETNKMIKGLFVANSTHTPFIELRWWGGNIFFISLQMCFLKKKKINRGRFFN